MRAVAVLMVIVVLAVGQPATDKAEPLPVSIETTPYPPAGGYASDMDVEFSADCDQRGAAFNVQPDTPDAIEGARRFCLNAHASIAAADWPAGFHP